MVCFITGPLEHVGNFSKVSQKCRAKLGIDVAFRPRSIFRVFYPPQHHLRRVLHLKYFEGAKGGKDLLST
jgi:hypothetical protein